MKVLIEDSFGKEYEPEKIEKEGRTKVVVKKTNVKDTDITVKIAEFKRKAGDRGFYLLPDTPQKGSFTVNFKKIQDCSYVIDQLRMPMFAVSGERSYLVIAAGMGLSMQIVTGVAGGIYYIYPKFKLDGYGLYEDMTLEIIKLNPYCGVADIAKAYRAYQMENGCIPIAERAKNNPVLNDMVDAIEVRVRMGWKPVPSPISEQTEENEPDMHVACTFERVRDLIDEMKRQGIDKAQITLVGWNKSGHDGRWPQVFPVEERLGGEKELKKLVDYAKKNRYLLSCHTNSTDAYLIANNWDVRNLLRKEDGEFDKGFNWSGGTAYFICPKCAKELARQEFPKIKKIGFNGGLYIDVLTAIAPKACFNKAHQLTKRETVENWKEIMEYARELFGAVSSEGGFVYAPELLDYAYYTCNKQDIFDEGDEFFDEEIPFWQMVFNGIILSNAYTNTTNCTIKDKKTILKAIEYNARQTYYLYSKFMCGSDFDDWLGKDDIICGSDDELKYAVSKIKEGYEIYKKTSKLNRCFIDQYEIIEKGVHQVTYSDGSVVTVDYNKLTYRIDEK